MNGSHSQASNMKKKEVLDKLTDKLHLRHEDELAKKEDRLRVVRKFKKYLQGILDIKSDLKKRTIGSILFPILL
jgi:hypothetical protein